MIGIGEEQAYLEGLVDELGIGDRVHLLGHVPYEDLPRWYCACSLFAMPNRDIGGDTDYMTARFHEAKACGFEGGLGL